MRCNTLISSVNLHSDITKMEKGYETRLGEGGFKFSGG